MARLPWRPDNRALQSLVAELFALIETNACSVANRMEYSEPQSKRYWLWTVLAYSAAIALFLLYGNLEISRSIYDDEFNLTSIESLDPLVQNLVGWSAFGAFLLLLVISSVSFKTNWPRWPAIGLLIGLALYPYCVLEHIFKNLAPWTTHGQITTDDGTTFVFCDSSFLQGQTMAIAEISSKDNLKTTFRVLVDNNGDSPRSWASVVRPERSTDEYGQLYLKDDFLIGVRYENKCYLAYDLKNNKAYGHGEIELLSPFVCLSANDVPNEIDIQQICDHITEHARFCETTDDIRHLQSFLDGEPVPGCPPTKELQAAVATKPAPVVSVANRILDCYDDAYAKLKTRIATSSATNGATEQTDEREPE